MALAPFPPDPDKLPFEPRLLQGFGRHYHWVVSRPRGSSNTFDAALYFAHKALFHGAKDEG